MARDAGFSSAVSGAFGFWRVRYGPRGRQDAVPRTSKFRQAPVEASGWPTRRLPVWRTDRGHLQERRAFEDATVCRRRSAFIDVEGNGAPGKIRTPDPQIRSLVLYPAELPVLRPSCRRTRHNCQTRGEAVRPWHRLRTGRNLYSGLLRIASEGARFFSDFFARPHSLLISCRDRLSRCGRAKRKSARFPPIRGPCPAPREDRPASPAAGGSRTRRPAPPAPPG